MRAQLDLLAGSGPLPEALLPLYEDPERHLGRLAAEMQAYWRAAIEPIWSRLAGLLDAEIGYRADQLTSGGIVRLLGNLHPELEYAEDALRILWPTWQSQSRLDGAGVLLVPCVFAWPSLLVDTDPRAPTLIYSPRGVGQVWDGSARSAGAADRRSARAQSRGAAGEARPSAVHHAGRPGPRAERGVGQRAPVGPCAARGWSRPAVRGGQVLYQRTALGTELLGAAVGRRPFGENRIVEPPRRLSPPCP